MEGLGVQPLLVLTAQLLGATAVKTMAPQCMARQAVMALAVTLTYMAVVENFTTVLKAAPHQVALHIGEEQVLLVTAQEANALTTNTVNGVAVVAQVITLIMVTAVLVLS